MMKRYINHRIPSSIRSWIFLTLIILVWTGVIPATIQALIVVALTCTLLVCGALAGILETLRHLYETQARRPGASDLDLH